MHDKIVREQLKTRKKKQGVESKIFFETFQNKTDYFFKRPKKKIDKRKSRKVTSRNAKNQEKTWNKQGKQDDASRKEKQEIKHRRREVKKKKTEFRREKWAQKFLIFFFGRNIDGDEKKGKEEGSQDKWDQEQKREKRNDLKQKEDTQKRRWGNLR